MSHTPQLFSFEENTPKKDEKSPNDAKSANKIAAEENKDQSYISLEQNSMNESIKPVRKIPPLPLPSSSPKPPLPPSKPPSLVPLLNPKSNHSVPSSARFSKKSLIEPPSNSIKPLTVDLSPDELRNPNDLPNFEGFSDNEEKEDDYFDDFAFELPVEQSFDKMILDGKKKCEISVLLQKLRSSR